MVKLVYKKDIKQPKGPCVVVIHANWCGHCKTLMPKFENEIVESSDFNQELEGLLTLGSIEESEYDDAAKKSFGEVDGYPTVRYIRFDQQGKPMASFDLPPTVPRESDDIIEWINGSVKNDVVKEKKVTKTTKTKRIHTHTGGKRKRKINRKTKRKRGKRTRKTLRKIKK
jgi:thiol-disulfide isomerase/thioredoxin